jgi:hypothetical protein
MLLTYTIYTVEVSQRGSFETTVFLVILYGYPDDDDDDKSDRILLVTHNIW